MQLRLTNLLIALTATVALFFTACKKEFSKDEPFPDVFTPTVYIASQNQFVYAMDPNTGKKKWEFNAGANVQASPLVMGTYLYVAAEDGKVYKLESAAYDAMDTNYPKLKGSYFSGGAGLSSTVEDYAKFLQVFLNGGEFNGNRLLSRKTVDLMLTDQLPDLNNEFGLGFGLETEKNDYRSPASIGTFSWGGAFSTQYWADPA